MKGKGSPCVHSTPKRGRASPSAAQTMQAVTGSGWREAPSCLGRRMSATAANLIERVLPPQSGLRPWVLTFRSRAVPYSFERKGDAGSPAAL